MGFWDAIGTVAKGAINSINEYNSEMLALKERMSEKSTDELHRIVKNDGFFGSSQKEKAMAYHILKQRGEV